MKYIYLPNTRKEARELGLKKYFTLRFCKRGHLGTRGVKSSTCNEYSRIFGRCHYHRKKFDKEYMQKRSEYSKEWIKNNPEKQALSQKKWRDLNKDYCKEYNKKWYEENRDLALSIAKEYKSKNRDKYNRYEASRRSLKKQSIPQWADKDEIEYIYKLASEKGLEVDHIVPLNSPYVCGLHTGDNLRCIPAELNYRKGNRYWPDMPEELKERRY